MGDLHASVVTLLYNKIRNKAELSNYYVDRCYIFLLHSYIMQFNNLNRVKLGMGMLTLICLCISD